MARCTRMSSPAPDAAASAPPTYAGIEGARAWLAWIVVASHVGEVCGYSDSTRLARTLERGASLSVSVFIIISGFVITHLVLTRHEPYGRYIVRRALRIFPAYLVALLPALAAPMVLDTVIRGTPWADAIIRAFTTVQSAEASGPDFPLHVAAHVLLLHGAIPNQVLPQSQFEFLPPAWSLSLEWQFYLVAPLWIALQRRRATGIAVAIVVLLGWIAFAHGRFGDFSLPSMLPGAAPYFLAGILTRLAIRDGDAGARARSRALLVSGSMLVVFGGIGVFAAIPRGPNLALALLLWMILVLHVVPRRTHARFPWDALLEGRVALAWGRRSYVVYILHWPVLVAVAWAVQAGFAPGARGTVLAVTAIGLPLTALSAELVHRVVESPAIALGRRLAASPARLRYGVTVRQD